MRLLHLTYDYPDSINSNKTEAIKNLIDVSGERNSTFCISLNRTLNFKKQLIYKNGNITALNTFGLPMGIFFSYTLKRSIKSVLSTGLDMNTFEMLHAHKLSFEGPIAYFFYKKYGIPYIVTIQQTDFKVLKYKPLMTGFYYKILLQSKKIITISPWMKDRLIKALGSKRMKILENKICNIPLIIDRSNIFKNYNNGKFLCVFHMRDDYLKIKNIYRVLEAISRLKASGHIIELDIAGDGAARDTVAGMIKKLNIASQVKMLGKVDNCKIIDLMSEYKAFVMCSYPETFGMVYIEALSAGIPVIYSKNAGIDGFFDGRDIGIAVHHNSIEEICNALQEINVNQDYYKDNVLRLQKSGYLNIFSREAVKQKYNSMLDYLNCVIS